MLDKAMIEHLYKQRKHLEEELDRYGNLENLDKIKIIDKIFDEEGLTFKVKFVRI